MDQLRERILDLHGFVDTLPVPLQLLALFLIGMIPFLEGDVAATVGVVAGIHWLPSILLGVAGTILVTLLVLRVAHRFGERRENRWADHKVMHRVQQWGVPAGMVISGFLFSVPAAAFIMRSSGLGRSIVLTSAVGVIILNGFLLGLVALGVLRWVVGV